MKILDLEQRSDIWKTWREEGIGASESAAVMGMSRYKTAYQLWEEKTHRAFPQAMNADMQRGVDLEDEARFAFQKAIGKVFLPTCCEHDKLTFLHASLDGLALSRTEFIEIKCPRSTKMGDAICTKDSAIVKEMFPEYWCQMQHQYAVCDKATNAYLVSYQNGTVNWIVIDKDPEFIKQLIEKIGDFWKHVKDDKPISLSDADYAVLMGFEAINTAGAYRKVVEERKVLEAREKELKVQLQELSGNRNAIIGNSVRLTRYDMSRVDYKKACEAFEIDTTPYIKTTMGCYRFTLV